METSMVNSETALQVAQKLTYAAPKLPTIGSLEKITQASGSGAYTDAAYSAGHPATDIYGS